MALILASPYGLQACKNMVKIDTLYSCGYANVTVVLVIPLSHYSRNAPRIHNVGHIFQIAKVPSGVCKIRPAFLLDSATFLAIANARGNLQGGSCVSGRYFIFSKIREFIKNPIQQTYERTNTIR